MASEKRPLWTTIACFALGGLLSLCGYLTITSPKTLHHKEMLMSATVTQAQDPWHGPVIVDNTQINALKHPITIPLEKDDRALMLEATLDHDQRVTFILDTGATYTAISRELAESLGYDLRHVPRVNITTANGQVSLPKVTLKSLTLNGYTAYNVEATVMNMPKNLPFSGLLGLSFVKRHRITIDSQAEHVVIEPRRS